jgi:hypothetical protein
MKHLDIHKILLDSQHGFRARRSCETQLLETLDDITKMAANNKPEYGDGPLRGMFVWSSCVYTDLNCAFSISALPFVSLCRYPWLSLNATKIFHPNSLVPPSQTTGQILRSRNYQDAKRKHIAKPGDLILTGQNTRD